MDTKKSALIVSLVALVMVVGMFVGMSAALTQTTGDFEVALVDAREEAAAKAEMQEVIAAANRAYIGAAEVYGGTEVGDNVVALADGGGQGYTEPLGESQTVRTSRSQSLASVVAVEVTAVGVLAFFVVFFASRIVKKMVS